MWARTTFEIGKVIRVARKRRKLSQADLDRLLATTQAWISEIERRKDVEHPSRARNSSSQLSSAFGAKVPVFEFVLRKPLSQQRDGLVSGLRRRPRASKENLHEAARAGRPVGDR